MNIAQAVYIRRIPEIGQGIGEAYAIMVTIDGQELSVPLDPANRHYAEIMRQVEAGTLVIQAAE